MKFNTNLDGMVWNEFTPLTQNYEKELSLICAVENKIYAFDRNMDRALVHQHENKITSICYHHGGLFFAVKDKVWVWKTQFMDTFLETHACMAVEGDSTRLCSHKGKLYAAKENEIWNLDDYELVYNGPDRNFKPTGLISFGEDIHLCRNDGSQTSYYSTVIPETKAWNMTSIDDKMLAIGHYKGSIIYSNGFHIETLKSKLPVRSCSSEYQAIHSNGDEVWLGAAEYIWEHTSNKLYQAVNLTEEGNVTSICHFPRFELFRRGVFDEV